MAVDTAETATASGPSRGPSTLGPRHLRTAPRAEHRRRRPSARLSAIAAAEQPRRSLVGRLPHLDGAPPGETVDQSRRRRRQACRCHACGGQLLLCSVVALGARRCVSLGCGSAPLPPSLGRRRGHRHLVPRRGEGACALPFAGRRRIPRRAAACRHRGPAVPVCAEARRSRAPDAPRRHHRGRLAPDRELDHRARHRVLLRARAASSPKRSGSPIRSAT